LTIKFSQDKKKAVFLNCQRTFFDLSLPQNLWGNYSASFIEALWS